jgi:hypothetical protein
MFGLAVNMALNPSLREKLLPYLIAVYREQLKESAPQHYLDKSHPNIWIAEQLKQAFDRALFIGIERNPYATVASMLRHREVLAWHDRWREFPVPNPFLGIEQRHASDYGNIPVAAKCAMRWLSHHEQMRRLRSKMPEDLHFISYETFAHQTDETISRLRRFLKLGSPVRTPDVKTESLHKWKAQLSTQQLQQIEGVVGFSADDAADGRIS